MSVIRGAQPGRPSASDTLRPGPAPGQTAPKDRPALRSDLVALARRLDIRQKEDSEALEGRLVPVEAAIDRIESRLFVELEPLIEKAAAAAAAAVPKPRRGRLFGLLMLLIGIGLGTAFAAPIREFGENAISAIPTILVPEREHSGSFNSF